MNSSGVIAAHTREERTTPVRAHVTGALSRLVKVNVLPKMRRLLLLGFLATGTGRFSVPTVSVGSCETTAFEKKLTALTSSFFNDGVSLGPGSVVDCGANEGGEACHYALLDPNRTVHALEPLPTNIVHVRRYAARIPNIDAMEVALGSATRRVSFRGTQQSTQVFNVQAAPSQKQDATAGTFRVVRLDDLFAGPWRNERLAFLHLDVEGAELDALHGGMEIIRRDRPLFTVEVHLVRDYTLQLMAALSQERYAVHLLQEACGLRKDCRNLICRPVERPAAAELLRATVELKDAADLMTRVGPHCSRYSRCDRLVNKSLTGSG